MSQGNNDSVLFYEGRFYALSNFSAFMVSFREREWMTSEHAYQAMKFVVRSGYHHAFAQILDARSAHDARQIAKKYKDFVNPDFHDNKLYIMEEILRAKLAQHEYVHKTLRRTGERLIVEDSPKDSFWGRGPDWKGKNHLGKIWMKLRDGM